MNIRDLLIHHEGLKYKPYVDTVGKITIGVGRNLTDNGLMHSEVLSMLDNDINSATNYCAIYMWFPPLSEARQNACIDLMFNLGPSHFRGFVKFIAAMQVLDYEQAGQELVNSAWFKQVGKRGQEIVDLIKYETYPI